MNNIKKLALGLLVATFAFGFSAFSNVQQDVYEFRYYGVADNISGTEFHWQSAAPDLQEVTCEDTPSGACIISTPSATPPSDDSMPSGLYNVESDLNKLYK